jgi:hypothetical protein
VIALTIDVDWAPDWMIERLADALETAAVRATWFVTHDSPALARLRAQPELFELGIHPNFRAGSTHGEDPDAVLDHLMAIVPEAVSTRSHCLVESTPLLTRIVHRTPVRLDSTTFLPDATDVRPAWRHTAAGPLLRVPLVWLDDYEPLRPQPDWDLRRLLGGDGVAVLGFHPTRVCLNLARQEDYERLKGGLADTAPGTGPLAGDGPATAFAALVERLARDGGGVRLRDLL